MPLSGKAEVTMESLVQSLLQCSNSYERPLCVPANHVKEGSGGDNL